MEGQFCSDCKYENEPSEFPLCRTCKKGDRNGFFVSTHWEPKEEEKLCKNCGVSSLEDQMMVCTHCFDHSKWKPKVLPLPYNEGVEKEEKEMTKTDCHATANPDHTLEPVCEVSIARMAQTALYILYDVSDTLRSIECTVMGDKTLQSACTATSIQPENLTDNIKYILEAANNLNARLTELHAKIAG